MLAGAVGDEELRILGPPIAPLAQADLFLAQRFAVGGGGILLVRRAVADMAIQSDEGRAALCLMEYPEGVLDQIDKDFSAIQPRGGAKLKSSCSWDLGSGAAPSVRIRP
jgi:hypothetical protein